MTKLCYTTVFAYCCVENHLRSGASVTMNPGWVSPSGQLLPLWFVKPLRGHVFIQ